MALGKIGDDVISNIDEDTETGRKCKLYYEQARDEVLEAFPWDFAGKRATLAQDATAPAFEYDYRYALPSDYINMRDAYVDDAKLESDSSPWIIEGQYLLTNEDEIDITYTFRETTTTRFTPTFVSGVVILLGSMLASGLKNNSKRARELLTEYEIYVSKSKRLNARASRPDRLPSDTRLQQRQGV
jgi:hypothetical protein